MVQHATRRTVLAPGRLSQDPRSPRPAPPRQGPLREPESAADVLAALAAIEREPATVTARTEPDERSLDALAVGVFVGRRKELETLRATLEETLSGHGRLVTLVGEPGIGKTRTATEFTTFARLRRAQVLWGRCYESAGAPPYWPFVQALRHLFGLLAQTMGRSDAAISHFDVALAFCEQGGPRPAYGWAAADYAALVLERIADDDHARGVAMQSEALVIGRELGMRPLVERVLARREFLKA